MPIRMGRMTVPPNTVLTAREPAGAVTRLIVDRLWCVSDALADGTETLLPSGRAQLLFSLSGIALCEDDGADPRRGPLELFQGPTTVARRISRKAQISACGVSFTPGGAGALFGPIDGTADGMIDLARFWGDAAADLREELRRLGTHEARLDRLEAEVERRIGDVSAARVLAHALERLRAGIAVKDLCRELELSPHSFRRLFLRNVGLTPKHYLGIERFRSAIAGLTQAVSLADLAADARYSDQSHMTREIGRFASMTPGGLRASVRPYVGHVRDSRR
jgi:AraC-like DNA-binding protein